MWSRDRMHEQRAHSRLKQSLPCEVRIGQVSSPGFLLDVSLGGALISSKCVPQKGDDVSITIVMPKSGKNITLSGRIIRASQDSSDKKKESFRFAMRFYGVTPESMLLVKSLI